MQHSTVRSIHDIKLTLHTTFNIPKGKNDNCITGCIVCQNDKLIFVDWPHNNRLVILNDDGTLDGVITCSMGDPFDVACLDDATVVVSTNNGIEIININSTKTERCIKTIKPCRGITHHNGVLLWVKTREVFK